MVPTEMAGKETLRSKVADQQNVGFLFCEHNKSNST